MSQIQSFLLHHFCCRLCESCVQWFLGSFLETSLLQLNLLCQTTSLNVWKQERLNKIFYKSLVVVISSFKGFKVLIHFLFSQICHNTSLSVWCSFNSVVDNPVEITVNCSLIHLDNLLVKTLLSSSDDLFCISSTSLFNFSISSLVLSFFDFCLDFLLFCCSH